MDMSSWAAFRSVVFGTHAIFVVFHFQLFGLSALLSHATESMANIVIIYMSDTAQQAMELPIIHQFPVIFLTLAQHALRVAIS